MMHRLGLDIASDLRLSIGVESVKVTPRVGLALAQSLITVSTRELVRQEAEAERSRLDRTGARRTKPK